MDSLNLLSSIIIKFSFASFHRYPSDSSLNYSHLTPVFKKNASTFTENFNSNDNDHHCNEGSVKVVSYEQFIKLLKSVK